LAERAAELLTAERIERLRSVADSRLGCLTAVYDGLHNERNVSACLRSSEAFGLQHVHLVSTDTYRAHKAIARGADRWLTVHRHAEPASCTDTLHAEGYTIWGTALEDGAESVFDLPLPPRLAIMVGSEHDGLSAEARAGCDRLVIIPMSGFTQSLNVSTAVTVLLQYLALAYRRELGDAALLPPAEREALYRQWLQRDVDRRLREKKPRSPHNRRAQRNIP